MKSAAKGGLGVLGLVETEGKSRDAQHTMKSGHGESSEHLVGKPGSVLDAISRDAAEHKPEIHDSQQIKTVMT